MGSMKEESAKRKSLPWECFRGTASGNWPWRMLPGEASDKLAEELWTWACCTAAPSALWRKRRKKDCRRKKEKPAE